MHPMEKEKGLGFSHCSTFFYKTMHYWGLSVSHMYTINLYCYDFTLSKWTLRQTSCHGAASLNKNVHKHGLNLQRVNNHKILMSAYLIQLLDAR